METRFSWDPDKAQRNVLKHGISFETAIEVFSDPNVVVLENYSVADEGEQRYGAIGMTRALSLVLTVFVDRSEPGFEVIHIISARKAQAYEESAYEDQFR